MTLTELLSTFPEDQRLLIGETAELTIGQVLERANSLSGSVQGHRLAIKLGDPMDGIEALVAADGNAISVTLLPPTLEDSHLGSSLELADCDLLLCDSMPTSEIPSHVVCRTDRHTLRSLAVHSAGRIPATSWHLATSGTTGTRKLVAHNLATLSRTAKYASPDAPAVRWGLLYDYTRFAGLQVVLQALLGGAELLIPPPSAPLSERVEMLAAHGCTHLSATPTLWRSILMTKVATELPLRQVTLGGEIADARILSVLQATFPRAHVTHIYASTEAGVGFSVNDGQAGFPASYLERPPARVALRLVNDQLQIKNTEIDAFYVGTSDSFGAGDGWISTGDIVEQSGDRIFFLGRASGVINVGGNMVHPEEVEQLLLSHPDVLRVRVFAKSSAIMGALVAADVVPNKPLGDVAGFRTDLKVWLQGQVEPYKIPVIINLVDHIETTATGKLARRKPA